MHKLNRYGGYRHLTLLLLALLAGCTTKDTGASLDPVSAPTETVSSPELEDDQFAELILGAVVDNADLVEKWIDEEGSLEAMGAIEYALIPTDLLKRGESGKIAVLCLSDTDSASAAENLLYARAQAIVDLGPRGFLVALKSPARSLLAQDFARSPEMRLQLQEVAGQTSKEYPEHAKAIRSLVPLD